MKEEEEGPDEEEEDLRLPWPVEEEDAVAASLLKSMAPMDLCLRQARGCTW